MYSLIQAGIIAHMALKGHLCPFRYEPAPITPGLWCHKKNRITFTLVVDGFLIRYQRREYAQYLINTLK